MATIKHYIVKRAGFAPRKGGGDVHISRHNQDQIPALLSKASIRERVASEAFEEVDTGVEETEAETEDTESAEVTETRSRRRATKE